MVHGQRNVKLFGTLSFMQVFDDRFQAESRWNIVIRKCTHMITQANF